MTRDLSNLAIDRVAYVIWCNDEGKVLDDGTVFRLGENDFRLCAQHHQLEWLSISRLGFNVNIEKEADDIEAQISAIEKMSAKIKCKTSAANEMDALR